MERDFACALDLFPPTQEVTRGMVRHINVSVWFYLPLPKPSMSRNIVLLFFAEQQHNTELV